MEAGILSLKEKPQEDKLPHYSSYHAMGILLALVGMSAQWSFLHSITFLGSVIGVQSEVEPGSAWIANSLGTFTVFLLIFALSRRITPLLEKRALYPAAALCLVGGIALLLVGNLLFSSPACNYAGNVLVACGATPLIIMWGELYKYLDPKGEQLLVTLSAATLAVVAYLVEILLLAPLSVAMFAMLPSCPWGASPAREAGWSAPRGHGARKGIPRIASRPRCSSSASPCSPFRTTTSAMRTGCRRCMRAPSNGRACLQSRPWRWRSSPWPRLRRSVGAFCSFPASCSASSVRPWSRTCSRATITPSQFPACCTRDTTCSWRWCI